MFVKAVELENDLDFSTMCYFYIDENTRTGLLIDPGAEPDKLLRIIHDNNWKIEKILLTHGHFDHIGAVEKLHKELKIPYYIHHIGLKYLKNPALNLSSFLARPIILNEAIPLKDNEKITLDKVPDFEMETVFTPGHTEDSVIFYDKSNHLAFVGDTIFKNSIGATHFPGGDYALLQNSIKEKIFTMPENTILYSGHSEPTDVKTEKQRYL